jgi:hypothetical protein
MSCCWLVSTNGTGGVPLLSKGMSGAIERSAPAMLK